VQKRFFDPEGAPCASKASSITCERARAFGLEDCARFLSVWLNSPQSGGFGLHLGQFSNAPLTKWIKITLKLKKLILSF
jgi:hypothetical protein